MRDVICFRGCRLFHQDMRKLAVAVAHVKLFQQEKYILERWMISTMKRRRFLQGLTLTAASSLSQISHAQRLAEREDRVAKPEGDSERFSAQSRVRSGIALGGIGAGSVELRKDGQFYNWSIFNNLPKETGPVFRLPEDEIEEPMASVLFFKVRYQVDGEEPRIQLLQLPNGLNEGAALSIAYLLPWMQAVDSIDYGARFPFARLRYSASEMPFEIDLEAWSPFIPHDVKDSSLPHIYFDFTLIPKTNKRVDVMLVMSARNTAGYDQPDRFFTTDIHRSDQRKTIVMSCGGMEKSASTWGEIALSSFGSDSSHYTGWSHLHPYYEYVVRNKTLPDLDDTNGGASMGAFPAWMPATGGRNFYDPKTGQRHVRKSEKDPESRLFCSLAHSFVFQSNAPVKHSFALSWNFPNLYSEGSDPSTRALEGHYYSNFFMSALEVADYAASNRESLLGRSKRFHDDFFDSSIEPELLEQVNSHLNTFITSGRLVKSGSFGILEGLTSKNPWGPIATIDVMLYGTVPIIALFPELQKATMRCHAKVQSAEGEINHGLLKNFSSGEDGTAGVSHRLDLPGQFIILVTRDYLWTGDLDYLRELYPHIQRAIDYILRHRAFAGNSLPIMRGIESSYDNFPMYGYASYLLSQWACALAGAIVAAQAMGDSASQARYEGILKSTQQAIDDKLWNGAYYRLYNDTDRAGEHGGVSEGILTDQMVGQWLAHHSNLGYILPKPHIDKAMRSILAANYRSAFGLKNCSWPGDSFLSPVPKDIWVDQANTCWTGVELAFASHLLYEGFRDEAEEVIRTVDRRYRRNGLYWDHQEYGGHYFRPMSSWGIVNSYLGLGVHAGTLRFAPRISKKPFKLFFAISSGTGHYIAAPNRVHLRCCSGAIAFDRLEIEGVMPVTITLRGASVPFKTASQDAQQGFTRIEFAQPIELKAEEELVILHS